MGILDMLSGMTPEQSEGLLGMAAKMLQASGPSRMPVGFGQVLGAGLGGFSEAKTEAERRKLERQHAEQQAKLMGYKIQDAESDLQNQEAARQRMQRIAARVGGLPQAGASGGQEAAAALPQAGAAGLPQSGGGGNQTDAYVQRLLTTAQIYATEGDIDGANKLYEQATKLRPKYSNEVTWLNGADGKPVGFRMADDGSRQQLDGLSPREKLEFRDGGGQLYGLDSYSGEVRKQLTKTMAPGEVAADRRAAAANAITMRGQDLTDARARAALALQAQKEKAPTEFQGKSAAFGARAAEADKIIGGLTGQYSPARVNGKMSAQDLPLVGGISGAIANSMLTESDQQAEQAQRDFINAVLRQESGAAIGESEFLNARRQYFPQPGDSAATIAQKQKNRALAVQGLNNNAGRAAFTPAAAPAGGGVKFLGFE